MAVTARFAAVLALAMVLPIGRSLAQEQPVPDASDSVAPTLPGAPPAPFRPDAEPQTSAAAGDTWIFSGELQGSHESFSGTLVTSKTDAQFELKLAGGATCDGKDLTGDIGLVRLSEITCSDDRTMRALFVPQGGKELRVFGHVGGERFVTSAHLLGTEAIPEPKQTAAPPGDAPAPAAKPPEPSPRP